MKAKHTVELTANFERNLEEIESFLGEIQLPQEFDILLDELTEIVVPNLERFPDMGRSFLERPIRSVETENAIERLKKQLCTISRKSVLREYIMTHYIVLYAHIESTIYLLSIRHQRQLSLDFAALWTTAENP